MSRYVNRPQEQTFDPFNPDGTWAAEWPPEVWLTKWRVKALGYRKLTAIVHAQITEAARLLYMDCYGQEPPRRGRRDNAYTIVFEHARVHVIDDAAALVCGPPTGRRRFIEPLMTGDAS